MTFYLGESSSQRPFLFSLKDIVPFSSSTQCFCARQFLSFSFVGDHFLSLKLLVSLFLVFWNFTEMCLGGVFLNSHFSVRKLFLLCWKINLYYCYLSYSLSFLLGTPIGQMLDFLHGSSWSFSLRILGNSYQVKETVVSWSMAEIELDDSLHICSSPPFSATMTGWIEPLVARDWVRGLCSSNWMCWYKQMQKWSMWGGSGT